MDVLGWRPLLLSNFEVLDFVERESKEQQVAGECLKQKRKDFEARAQGSDKALLPFDEGRELARLIQPENVHTAQKAVIDWQREAELCTASQTASQVTSLTKALAAFDSALTKLEILQIVNTVPQALPELYVIIEQFEERFQEDRREKLFQLIQSQTASNLHEGLATYPSTIVVQPPPKTAPIEAEEEDYGEQDMIMHATDDEEENELFISGAGQSGTYREDLEIDEQAES